MNKLMKYINSRPQDYQMRFEYSTPSRYIAAIHSTLPQSWEVKSDDDFPYSWDIFDYWTGYFTSRPALKGYVRTRNALLRASDKMCASTAAGFTVSDADVLRQAFSVAQHHDAVSGTSMQHVANDYAKLLANGSVAIQQQLGIVVSMMANSSSVDWSFCEYLTETICPTITKQLGNGNSVPLALFNSLTWDRTEVSCLKSPSSFINCF
jgi:hypothetical protein